MPLTLNQKRSKGVSHHRLSDKQLLFCQEYLANGCNASKAAEVAGYKNPGKLGQRLLNHPLVKAYLQRRGTVLLEKKELRAEDVIDQIRRVLQFNMMRCFRHGGGGYLEVIEEDWDIVADAIGDCVTEVNFKEIDTKDKDGNVVATKRMFKLKLISKERMLELAARYLGLVQDTKETGTTFVQINWDDMFVPKPRVNRIEEKIREVEARAVQAITGDRGNDMEQETRPDSRGDSSTRLGSEG